MRGRRKRIKRKRINGAGGRGGPAGRRGKAAKIKVSRKAAMYSQVKRGRGKEREVAGRGGGRDRRKEKMGR